MKYILISEKNKSELPNACVIAVNIFILFYLTLTAIRIYSAASSPIKWDRSYIVKRLYISAISSFSL